MDKNGPRKQSLPRVIAQVQHEGLRAIRAQRLHGASDVGFRQSVEFLQADVPNRPGLHARRHRVVAAHVEFERHILKPGLMCMPDLSGLYLR
jgi:hypothetical protein